MNQIHEGRNVKRFRELLGIKPDTLAELLGDDWNSKKIALLEQKENIGDDLLSQISEALKIPVEAIKNLDDEKVVNIFSNNSLEGSQPITLSGSYNECHFELTDHLVKSFDDLIQVYKEKIEIYERMLKDKEYMIQRYAKMIDDEKKQKD